MNEKLKQLVKDGKERKAAQINQLYIDLKRIEKQPQALMMYDLNRINNIKAKLRELKK